MLVLRRKRLLVVSYFWRTQVSTQACDQVKLYEKSESCRHAEDFLNALKVNWEMPINQRDLWFSVIISFINHILLDVHNYIITQLI